MAVISREECCSRKTFGHGAPFPPHNVTCPGEEERSEPEEAEWSLMERVLGSVSPLVLVYIFFFIFTLDPHYGSCLL